jgi:hypothetical protein
MPYDALLNAGTASGSVSTNLGTVDLHGTPNRGLVARLVQTAGSAVGGTAKVWLSLSHTDDTGTWHNLADGTIDAFSLTSAGAITGEAFLPFRTNKRYVRPTINLAGGGTPTFTGYVEIGPAKP